MKQSPPKLSAKATAGLSAGAILALGMAVVSLKPSEGKVNVTYLDIAKVPTACYGHTGPDVKLGQRRTDEECETLLVDDARKYLDGVLACAPELDGHPYQLRAATELTFNIGISAFCSTANPASRSKIAYHFRRGNMRAACDGFLLWKFAAGKPVLLPRRQRERATCLTGVA